MGEGSGRPGSVIVVTGTGTEVGKTWVSEAMLRELSGMGIDCCARKPVQSFDPAEVGAGTPTDADVLAAATAEDPAVVCPPARNYPVAMAPPMAADVLDRPAIAIGDLLDELAASWPDPAPRIGLVELVGGIRSPIAHDGDCAGFVADLDKGAALHEVVIVADAGLGTISAVLSAIDSLEIVGVGIERVVVHLNRFNETDGLHRRNRAWLREKATRRLFTSPGTLAQHFAERC